MSALDGLSERIDDFEAAGARVIAVSPDTPTQNRGVVEKLELRFPILSDAQLELTRALGLVHVGGGPESQDIPRPAVFILEDGVIRWRALTENYRIRVRPDPLLAELARIEQG
jgi:peroxiredoxin